VQLFDKLQLLFVKFKTVIINLLARTFNASEL